MTKAIELIESQIKRIKQKIQKLNDTLPLSTKISLTNENFINMEIIKNLTKISNDIGDTPISETKLNDIVENLTKRLINKAKDSVNLTTHDNIELSALSHTLDFLRAIQDWDD